MKCTVLVVPQNDAESVLICEIARTAGIQLIVSRQGHGASLDREPELVELVRDGGWSRVVVVEMPGARTEARLKKLGCELVVIDHHQYDGLDRSRDGRGRTKPSSLEQFLSFFKLADVQLKALGFDPRLVRGIGIQDRGFVWALRREGYSAAEIRAVLRFHDALLKRAGIAYVEAPARKIAQRAWVQRKRWNGFWVVQSRSSQPFRLALSRLIALKYREPQPTMLIEHGRGYIYVQESPYAPLLFKMFGGFLFGDRQNWGYENGRGRRRVILRDIKFVITRSRRR